jgi:hypothetical protein
MKKLNALIATITLLFGLPSIGASTISSNEKERPNSSAKEKIEKDEIIIGRPETANVPICGGNIGM